ncbi:hypothetical protein ACFV3F_18970 [Streptomyces sp. NPDC059717]|uniref:hypothetical protein n=1 Tax=Streptomyces sp. NPDC059717 TaxID=3346922 RepID=UPI0036A0B837
MPEDLTVEHERAYKGLEALARLVEDSSGALQPAGEDVRPFFVAWGMLANVHRQAAAVVLLHRQGFGHETAPNRPACSNTRLRSGGWPRTGRTRWTA